MASCGTLPTTCSSSWTRSSAGPNLDERKPGAAAVIQEHMGTKLGEALTWSRPGAALMWMEDIPLRVEWGGFLLANTSALFALDSRRMFLASSGDVAMQLYRIPHSCKTPEDLVRERVTASLGSSAGGLHPLTGEARKAVEGFRRDPANAWWLEAVRQDAVAPISIPLNSPPVQVSLFG